MSPENADKEEAKPSAQHAVNLQPGWKLRRAIPDDIPELEILIPLSVRTLQSAYYSSAQMSAALGPVFGVDRQLIRDGTYFVVTSRSRIIGCGGWSRRNAVFGSDAGRENDEGLLDPAKDAARIRAFFVHPDFARQGAGRALLDHCEREIAAVGFSQIVMVATLAGVPLYSRFGYQQDEAFDIMLTGGIRLPAVRMSKRIK